MEHRMGKTGKIAVVIALVLAVGFIVIQKTYSGSNDRSVSATQDQTALKIPRLLDLGADKCIPCKMMAPILEELKEEYAGRLEVVFIDVWKDNTAGRQYGIRAIPTQIFFAPDGSELFRHEGFYSREDILSKWNELGYDMEG
jgi:thioredoxin